MITTRYLAAMALLVIAGKAPLSLAQLPTRLGESIAPVPQNTPPTDTGPKAKRVENAQRLLVAERQLQSTKDAAPNGTPAGGELTREVQLRKEIDRIYAQHEAVRQRKTATEQSRAELADKLKTLRASGLSPPPYSFLLVDQLRDELDSEQARGDSLAATIAELEDVVDRHKVELEEKERAHRRAKETAGTNNDAAAQPPATEAWRLAELESRLADAELKLHQEELDIERLNEYTQKLRVEFLRARIQLLAKQVEFTGGDLQNRLAELDNDEIQLKRALDVVEANSQFLENQWFAARQRLEQAAANDAVLADEVDTRRVEWETQQRQVAILNQRLLRIEKARTAWSRRFKLATASPDMAEIDAWEQETETSREDLSREARLQKIRMNELRNTLSTLDGRIKAAEGAPPELGRWLNRRRDSLSQLTDLYNANLTSIESERRLLNRLLAELGRGEQAAPDRQWLAEAWRWLGKIWNYEISTVDDSPITIGKIITGLVFLFLGFVISRRLSRLFGRRLLRRLKVHESAAAALQSILFYVLLVVFAMISLRFANVPLTAFTILSGAIALGVGFGSQNIINNFISGLILLAERPIRVGDMVQLGELYGTVEKIGARSTWIRTGDNLEIVVPNSSFLENNVINMTLSDNRVRTSVKVGVVYGSQTRDVTRLLLRAATEHGKILADPEPFVWFVDFGDNSLNFEVHFWLVARSMSERRRIESDIRYRIDNLFRDAGIVIAFPQRDIHLDTDSPIEVRLTSEDDGRQSEGISRHVA